MSSSDGGVDPNLYAAVAGAEMTTGLAVGLGVSGIGLIGLIPIVGAGVLLGLGIKALAEEMAKPPD